MAPMPRAAAQSATRCLRVSCWGRLRLSHQARISRSTIGPAQRSKGSASGQSRSRISWLAPEFDDIDFRTRGQGVCQLGAATCCIRGRQDGLSVDELAVAPARPIPPAKPSEIEESFRMTSVDADSPLQGVDDLQANADDGSREGNLALARQPIVRGPFDKCEGSNLSLQ